MSMCQALLKRGYFPGELPPLFTTAQYAAAIGKTIHSLPNSMTKAKADWAEPTHHNLARVGGLRRRLSVPNPVNYYRLASLFEEQQKLLEKVWAESPFSKTTPSLTKHSDRALAQKIGDRAVHRAKIRVGARYLLKADISQFYPSIYTHSVPWAIHTKTVAKQHIHGVLPGNALDKELQACQRGQTKGIPIGPDTSLGIAELVMSSIDSALQAKCQMLGGVRFIDDMEFSFAKLADAENTLLHLEALLHDYELQLNGSKTALIELPAALESDFVSQLRGRVPSELTLSRSSWIDYFSFAFALAKTNRADGVLRYAVAALSGKRIHESCWNLAQDLLWQCIALDAGCLRFVIDILWISSKADDPLALDTKRAACALDALISASGLVGHGSEVVWSIWASMLFDLTLPTDAWNQIVQMDDDFVAIAAHAATQKRLPGAHAESPLWKSWLVEGCFTGPHWLFAYEAHRRGWMKSSLKVAKINKVEAAVFLKDKGVSFFRTRAAASFKPTRLPASITKGVGGGGY
jgi:hypothetical protein